MRVLTALSVCLAAASVFSDGSVEEVPISATGDVSTTESESHLNIMARNFDFGDVGNASTTSEMEYLAINDAQNAMSITEEDTTFLIIGGTTVSSAATYPFFVALPRPDGTRAPPACGGSLIAPNVVLSAAHCADGRSVTLVGQTVTIGAYQQPFTGDGSQTAVVTEQLFSPGYNFGQSNPTQNALRNDFMLLRLDRDVVVDDYMRLSNYVEDMKPGTTLTSIGFGLLNPPPSIGQPEFLQEANQNVWFDGDCEIVYSSRTDPPFPLFVDGSVQVCVGGRTTMEVANGDSGGPVFRMVGNFYYQVGVVSWSEPNKIDPGVPDVMAQVPLNENGFDWIRGQVCGDWNVEATFCIECDDDCDCPDNYECICYDEVESRRRKLQNKASKLKFLGEDFLSTEYGRNEEETYNHSSQEVDGGKPKEREKQRGRRVKSNRSRSTKSCKSGKVGKNCDSDESGYCFRSDTSLVDDFAGKKSSSSSSSSDD